MAKSASDRESGSSCGLIQDDQKRHERGVSAKIMGGVHVAGALGSGWVGDGSMLAFSCWDKLKSWSLRYDDRRERRVSLAEPCVLVFVLVLSSLS